MTDRPLATSAPADLSERLPAEGLPDAGDQLDVFLAWVDDRAITLYPAQEEAVLDLFEGDNVILKTPTGSGKSLVATAMHFRALATGGVSFYTSPIKALVSEKFFDLCDELGAANVGMMTGDATVNRDAPVICCTAEILANMALREGARLAVDHVVMDEFHFYGDRDRGAAWQIPLLLLEDAQFLLMSATLGDTAQIESDLARRTGRVVRVVTSDERPVPLDFSYRDTVLHTTVANLVDAGLAPIYLVNFTQREAAEQAQNLMSIDVASKTDKAELKLALAGVKFDSPYGKEIRRFLAHGIGLHHGGLLPRYRLLVERLARQGLLKVVSGTDTLGVGVNVPIRTVLFTQLCKYDGEKTRLLSVREFQQISGRAGRKGFDVRGAVVAQDPPFVIENRRLATKAAQQGRKKFTKKQPPKKGYVRWDRSTFERLSSSPPEALESVFDVDHGMMLNLLQAADADGDGRPGGGYRALMDLLMRSHERPGRRSRLRRKSRQLFQALRGAGIVDVAPREAGRGRRIVVSDALQDDFSLYESLSLFLVEALPGLDPEAPDYGESVMTFVEAILEHPRVVLYRQEDKLKGELIARLKAEGVEYDERMEQLKQVGYPKPMEEQIYAAFNSFRASHPWLEAEAIRPKSVARDMYEDFCSFNHYISDLGLSRSEGVLLRYLSNAYKVLVQSVPESLRNDAVLDVIAYLRTTLAQVDSSLVEAWERLLIEGAADGPAGTEAEPAPFDVSSAPRVFRARIRAELAAVVDALAKRDFEAAVAGFAPAPEPADPWSAERLEEAVAPFFEEHGRLVTGHRARLTENTTIRPDGDHRWTVSQRLLDPDDEDLWALHGEIDLTDDTAPAGPLIQLVRVGC